MHRQLLLHGHWGCVSPKVSKCSGQRKDPSSGPSLYETSLQELLQ